MQHLLCKCRQKGQKEMASVMFTVPGKPQGKARARTYYNASAKKHCSTTPDNTVLYENFIKDRYLQMAKGKYDVSFAIACVLLILVLALNGLTKYLAGKFDVENRK